jgi:hypothetical protein
MEAGSGMALDCFQKKSGDIGMAVAVGITRDSIAL